MSKDDPDTNDPRALGLRMLELVNGYQVSAAIGAVARLGVAERLSDGPVGIDELALRVGADPHALRRVLRILADAGLVERLADGRVALTVMGELLREGVPGSVHRGAILVSEEWHWRAYGHFSHSLRTGEPGFRKAHGVGFWEYLERHPQAGALVNQSMSRATAMVASAFAGRYEFGEMTRLVDVGAGYGTLMRTVLDAHPTLDGVVCDLPGVIDVARATLADAGLTDRCQAVPGNFFEAVPAGGDAYVLSWILHDWDDQAALTVLANCRAAMGDGGRLLVIELIVPPDGERQRSADIEWLVKTSDIEMLAVVGGRERTALEYGELFAGAGFALERIIPLVPTAWSVVEGSPI